jgi:hypothetical protein
MPVSSTGSRSARAVYSAADNRLAGADNQDTDPPNVFYAF